MSGISRVLNDPDHLTIRALLNIMIGDLVRFVNVGKTMSPGQLVETVSLVVKYYHHLKPADFKLCFEEIKGGKYGPMYDRIDGQVILSCLAAYDQERDYVAAEVNYNANELFKQRMNVPLLPDTIRVDDDRYTEVFKANIKKLRDNLDANKIQREKDKQQQKIIDHPVNPVYEMHQRWLNDFNKLRMKQCDRVGMITKYGIIKNPFYKPDPNSKEPKTIRRKLNCNEYLEHKQWQYELAMLPTKQRMNYYLTKYPKNGN